MKNKFFVFLILLFAGVRIISAQDVPNRKLTVMIYMCGSNLESLNGSASADIREMLEAGIDGKEVSLLVMTGGAGSWSLDFIDPNLIEIHEIGMNGRHRRVWQAPKMNMGNEKALIQLLKFGKEKYTAQNYALILWDHGGGPLEGICWDEQFSLDNLSLREITRGISDAELGQKLSWIGFDACLMSTLEVANALEPYAEYMIASQETEPAFGWNYSFLKGIGGDADGAATGRRIVDTYFEGHDDKRDVLTLACTDLGKAVEAVAAIDEFFAPFEKTLNAESFSVISNARLAASGFGEAIRSGDNEDYDLVDAFDLIIQLNDGKESGSTDLLQEAVIYVRSNKAGAHGLSLYHPFANKENYLNKWRYSYARLHFSESYTQYLNTFGALLTGTERTDWSRMETQYSGKNESGHHTFTLQLTQEQAENIASARLLILMNNTPDMDDIRYALISSTSAALDGDGNLSGVFSGKTLYVRNNSGTSMGPLSYVQSSDSEFRVLTGFYHTEEISNADSIFSKEINKTKAVQFFLDANDDVKQTEIIRTRVEDEVTGTFTSRIELSEEDYAELQFWPLSYLLPDVKENVPLPAFQDWNDPDTGNGYYFPVSLPGWSLYYSDSILSKNDIYAIFEITDLQANTYCSSPALIPNDRIIPFQVISEAFENDLIHVELSGNVLPISRELELRVKITNLTDHDERIQCDRQSFVLNGNRIVSYVSNGYVYGISPSIIPAHSSLLSILTIGADELIYLDQIDSVSFQLKRKIESENYTPDEVIPVEFQIEGCTVREIASWYDTLAEYHEDGLLVRLLALLTNKYEDNINGLLYIENDREETFGPYFNILANGIRVGNYTKTLEIPTGMSGISGINIRNDLFSEKPGGSLFSDYIVLYDHILQRMGFDYINDILLMEKKEYSDKLWTAKQILLHLDQPWLIENDIYRFQNTDQYTDIPAGYVNEPMLLAENNQYSIKFSQVCVSESHAVMGLIITNKTNHPLQLYIEDAFFNDLSVACRTDPDAYTPLNLDPVSISFIALSLATEDSDTEFPEIKDLSLVFRSDYQDRSSPSVITFIDSEIENGEGFRWIRSDEMSIQPAITPDVEEFDSYAVPETIKVSSSLPENSASARVWIEAPLDNSILSEIEEGYLVVVRKPSGKYYSDEDWQILSLQKLETDKNGNYGALFPGLIACIDRQPEICMATMTLKRDGMLIEGLFWNSIEFTRGIEFSDLADNLYIIKEIGYKIDYEGNTAEITEYLEEGMPFLHAYEMVLAKVYSMILNTDQAVDDNSRYSIESKNYELVNTGHQPLKLVFRRVTPKDELYLFYKFITKDGRTINLHLPYLPVRD